MLQLHLRKHTPVRSQELLQVARPGLPSQVAAGEGVGLVKADTTDSDTEAVEVELPRRWITRDDLATEAGEGQMESLGAEFASDVDTFLAENPSPLSTDAVPLPSCGP